MSNAQPLEFGVMSEVVPCGIFVIDANGEIVAWNKSAERITGHSEDEVVGQNIDDVMQAMCVSRSESGSLVEYVRQTKDIRDSECTFRREDGQIVTILKNVKAFFDNAGDFQGAIGAFTDISHLRQVENRLRLIEDDVVRRFSFGNIVGKSPLMQEVYLLIQHAAESNATVLIEGESGTGKELVAHAIHYNSLRADNSFVKVNCGALPEGRRRACFSGG